MSSNQKSDQSVESGGQDKGVVVSSASSSPKSVSKCVRIMTVSAYLFAVSFAAIVLSVYYIFFWKQKDLEVKVKV